MTRKEFEKVVQVAVMSLPRKFRKKIQNVEILIKTGSAKGKFLGLYEGVPLGDRGQGYSMVMHDRIILFRRAIEAECKAHKKDIRREIKCVILHEIAHHFGISDERLEDLGVY